MEKAKSRVVIAVFLAFSMLPSLGILVFGESKAAANQQLAPPPRWGAAVLQEAADWLNDHFALRQEMVTAWARINALFRCSVEDQVILGKDGWLFYEPTLADYNGEHLSPEELTRAAARIREIQDAAEAAGMQFLLVIVPNKSTVYPEKMPPWAVYRHGESNLEKLKSGYLDAQGIHYLALETLSTSGQRIPYYRTDSHWTEEGAAQAADAILKALGRESAYADGPFAQEGIHTGDLYEMLYPAAKGAEAKVRYMGPELRYKSLRDDRGGNAITIQTVSERGSGGLYCWRDSFGIALFPYLADSFANAVFSRSQAFDVPDDDYDVLLLEIVERNLPVFLTK